MDWQRYLLLGGLMVVVVMLFQEWNKFEEQHKPVVDTRTVVEETPQVPVDSEVAIADDEIPQVASEQSGEDVQQPASTQLISVKTDVLDVLINPRGGDIVKVALPKYLTELEGKQPLILLNQTAGHTYIAQSGLVGANGTDQSGNRPLFSTAMSSYQMDSEELLVDLHYQQGEVNITKRFTFKPGDYLVDVTYLVDNRSANEWKGNLYGQIKRDSSRPATDAGFGMQPFVGGAITTDEERYKKVSFEDLTDGKVEEKKTGGWVAVMQHYFLSAWVPPKEEENKYSLRKLGNRDEYLFGYLGPAQTIAAGQQGELRTSFYAGPKDQDQLEEIAEHLGLTIDYGWAWWVSQPLFALLTWMHNLVGNWGWAILLLTLCVRIPLYPLFAKSARSMAGMRKIQPEMQRLKELYGNDRQRMSQEMMGLYKKHKVNPMGGCLPMLLPMPIFIGLYYMLFESVELRHADWLWISDLSVKDPMFVLPLIMGLTMWLQQKLNPQPTEASMATAMKLMPVIFTFMFMWFPAGLVLYWTVNNIFSIFQSWLVNRKLGV
ncbi:membrane protein insertase YidC [Porticoccaceae bacterium LTM1]|nr:membrane protein insertase YidC [Porticoccaceae bacterium LTM1]